MQNPSQIYEDFRTDGLNGRELEASLLVRAARKLTRCAQLWPDRNSNEVREKLDEALFFNQKLWTFLQVELSNPEHPMPLPLRRNLLRLSRYVDQKILSLAAGGTLQDLESISKINEDLAAGLLAGAEKPVLVEPPPPNSGEALDVTA
jgi:flagellar protein FlaF